MQLLENLFTFAPYFEKMNNKKALGPWLGKTSKMIGCYINDVLLENDIDLTREQWVILKKLHHKDGLMQNELAIITERDKTSLTRLINTMERKEIVIRKRSETDKRANLVFLTNTGRDLFNNTAPIMYKTIQGLQKGLSGEEIQHTIHTLQKIQTNLTNLSTSCGINQS